MKIDISILDKYKKDGWLTNQKHPKYGLWIWNYTAKTQYDQYWDNITLMCRGLVTDIHGNVIAIPFKKFFNLEENKHIPTSEFEVFEKLDGSLGILFFYGGEWIMSSRGSFTSDQAIRAKKILTKYPYRLLPTDCTYLFEIIYPENRIVVNYGEDERLVLLGVFQSKEFLGTPVGFEWDLDFGFEEGGFDVVKRYNGIIDYSELKSKIDANSEGFVIRFSNGDRVKIKGEEYLRLHKIMTNISTKSIWEVISSGISIDSILEDVPDEIYQKIKDYEQQLLSDYDALYSMHLQVFSEIMNGKSYQSRKEIAQEVFKYGGIQYGLIFNLIDGKDIRENIWKLIKPEYKKI